MADNNKKSGVYAAIGNFDGFHRAHQALAAALCREAVGDGMPAYIIGFEPHPLTVIKGSGPLLLSDQGDKERMMRDFFGVDEVVKLSFDQEMAKMTAADFVEDILHKKFAVKHVFVGFNFTFGSHGSGDAHELSRLCAERGIRTTVIPACECDYGVISSSLIRQYLAEGKLGGANEMLGYWYKFSGITEQGNQKGRSWGFATANIAVSVERQLPPYGVYAARVEMDGKTYDAIVNLGTKPTVAAGNRVLLEAHLLDIPDEDLYNRKMEVCLGEFVRAEKKFADITELKEAVYKNIAEAGELLSCLPSDAHLIKNIYKTC